jgi:hypothetical protein
MVGRAGQQIHIGRGGFAGAASLHQGRGGIGGKIDIARAEPRCAGQACRLAGGIAGDARGDAAVRPDPSLGGGQRQGLAEGFLGTAVVAGLGPGDGVALQHVGVGDHPVIPNL